MKNYKKLILLTSILSTAAFSLPLITKGLTIVSGSESNSDDNKELIERIVKQEKERGYQYNTANNAEFLLNLKGHAKQEIIQNKTSKYGDYDTHLKNHYSEIKLAFKFTPLKAISQPNIIGYAAVGSYIKDDLKDGWNGLRVFFNEPSIGTCSYAYNEFHGAMVYKEFVEYTVNNKATQKTIEGSPETGFVYVVEWFNQANMSTIECANKNLDKTILDKMIMLANKIDKN